MAEPYVLFCVHLRFNTTHYSATKTQTDANGHKGTQTEGKSMHTEPRESKRK